MTIGALLGMAAHLEGKGVGMLDLTGLAQKGGAVMQPCAASPRRTTFTRCASARASRLVLGCDMVVAASAEALCTCEPGRTRVVVNTHQVMPTASFAQQSDWSFRPTHVQAHDRARAARRRRISSTPSSWRPRCWATHRHQPVHARLRLAKGLVPLGLEALSGRSNSTARPSR